MKTLQQILPETGPIPVSIHGISMDSREVKPGDLFIAVSGAANDGAYFIDEAIGKGAVAVLRAPAGSESTHKGIPVYEVENLAMKAGEIASRFYEEPSKALSVIAVTGTNGKTTVTSLITDALNALQLPCGVIGTLGVGRATRESTTTGLTTPDPVSLQRQLAAFSGQECQYVALEASSHGLTQGRLNGTRVAVSVLTNLTQDHLDYHGDMDRYREAKELLFEFPELETRIVNLDDDFGRHLAQRYRNDAVLSFSTDASMGADVFSRNAIFDASGLTAELVTPGGSTWVRSALLGPHNLSNLLAAATVLHWQGCCAKDIGEVLSGLKAAPGRMEVISLSDHASAVIDFAHTTDALLNVLTTLKQNRPEKLICVFGCGGDRDRGKRREMGAVAASLADQVILTNDNPRSESPQAIVDEILTGIPGDALVEVELDRCKAIHRGLELLKDAGLVLIAGKGHENYQEVNHERIQFSDREVVLGFIDSN